MEVGGLGEQSRKVDYELLGSSLSHTGGSDPTQLKSVRRERRHRPSPVTDQCVDQLSSVAPRRPL